MGKAGKIGNHSVDRKRYCHFTKTKESGTQSLAQGTQTSYDLKLS